ncbi:hypothetical protein, partial [Aeromonas caviae]|uniref:hypothetical protein n=1 Tax=Aeromonas caviae TaxID=648 RepID=UPI001CC46363
LAALEFRSNNDRHRPVMDALDLVKRFADTKVHTFPAGGVPLHDGFSPQATYHAIERHLHVGREGMHLGVG